MTPMLTTSNMELAMRRIRPLRPLKPLKPLDRLQNMKALRPLGKSRWVRAHWRYDYDTCKWEWILGHWSA